MKTEIEVYVKDAEGKISKMIPKAKSVLLSNDKGKDKKRYSEPTKEEIRLFLKQVDRFPPTPAIAGSQQHGERRILCRTRLRICMGRSYLGEGVALIYALSPKFRTEIA